MPYSYLGASLLTVTENGGFTETYNDITYAGGESVIVVVAAWGAGAIVGPAVDDGGFNTYTLIGTFGAHISLFYCHGVGAGTRTLRATRTSGSVGTLRAFRFSGITGAPIVSAGQEFTGTGAASPDNIPVGSPNVTTVPALLFAASRRQNDSSDMAAGTGFTYADDLNHLPAPGAANGGAQHRRITSTGVVVTAFSYPPNDGFNVYENAVVAFAEAATGPTINAQPTTQRVPAYTTAAFSVSATASAGGLSYQWQYTSSGSWANVSGGSGGTSASYTTPSLAAGLAYAVRCVVTDSNGSANTDVVDLWTPTKKPQAWASVWGRGGQRDIARAFGRWPLSKSAGLVAADALLDDASTASGAVGLATESDTAFARGSARPAGLASEVDASLARTAVQIRGTGLATEADASVALSALQVRATGMSSETDAALAMGSARPVGRADESGAAFALAGVHARAAGTSAEVDAALALGVARPAGRADETDAAFARPAVQLRATGLASETDAALQLGVARPAGLAVESDVATALAGVHLRAVGRADETDSVVARAGVQLRQAGRADEVDTAIALTAAAGSAAGLSSETDAAFALAGVQLRAAGLAAEADVAFALLPRQIRAAGLAGEVDAALARTAIQILAPGMALEIDTAFALSPGAPAGAAGRADEIDSAFALAGRQVLIVGVATEVDTAVALGTAGEAAEPQTPGPGSQPATHRRRARRRLLVEQLPLLDEDDVRGEVAEAASPHVAAPDAVDAVGDCALRAERVAMQRRAREEELLLLVP